MFPGRIRRRLTKVYTTTSHKVLTLIGQIVRGICVEHLHVLIKIQIFCGSVSMIVSLYDCILLHQYFVPSLENDYVHRPSGALIMLMMKSH